MKLNILRAITMIGPSLKSWVFADGKFKLNRALVLVGLLLILTIMYQVVGQEGVTFIVSMLDELSDVIGYE